METYQQLYKYAKRLALKWRHSKQNIKEKLLYKGAGIQTTEKIIRSLEKDLIIDDKRCYDIDVFVMEEKRYGYKRIKEYLLAKGYPKSLTDAYIFNKDIESDNCYYHFIKASKKFKNYKYSDDEREKIINYLKRCGFNGKIIYEVVKAGINYENVM